MCDQCWCRTVDGKPWCERCIHHLKATGNNVALAVSFVVLSAYAASVLWRHPKWQLGEPVVFWSLYIAGTAVLASFFGTRKRRDQSRTIRDRNALSSAPPAHEGAQRRLLKLTRAPLLMASPVSGVWTSGILIACMIVVGVALPGILHLPRWVEVEIVLGAWWLLWAMCLTVLLYRGWRISNDHLLAKPSVPWDRDENALAPSRRDRDGCGCDGCDPTAGCSDGSCGEVVFEGLIVAVVLAAVALSAWVVVELVAPTLFFFAYVLVRNSLARVANDRHDCTHDILRALAWGAYWASLYIIPFILLLAAIHRLDHRLVQGH
jgi:hypothetical protein